MKSLFAISLLAAFVLLPMDIPTARSGEFQDRVAVAIAIQNALHRQPAKTDAPSPPKEPTAKTEAKPVVRAYTASWCAPCKRAKAILKDVKDLPFDLTWIDVTNGGQPDWCESIPAFAWECKGQTRYVLGFDGVEKLVARWKATQSEKPATNKYPSMQGYQSRWTWPGDLRQHLQATHGISEAGGLTQDQAEALHDALHEGYSLQQIRNRMSK